MFLPHTHGGALFLAILSLVCLGSWPNLYKLAGKWRFELFYFDFAIGLMLTATIAALTLGSLGFDGFGLGDDLANAGKRQWMFAFLAGTVFNLGNMLLVAAMSVAGMAVAFVAGTGMMLLVAMLTGLLQGSRVDTTSVWFACGFFLAAIVAAALAYGALARARRAALPRDPKTGRKARGPGAVKGIVLALTGGAITLGMYPLVAFATPPEIGLGPYGMLMLFGFGVLISTVVCNIFFMNLPVAGEPLEIFDYLKGRPTIHLFGLAAGLVWYAGMLSNRLVGTVPPKQQLAAPLALGLPNSGLLLAALWGTLAWREFRGAGALGKTMAALMLVLAAGGLWMMSMAVAPLK